eukprot:gnl/TRDRNA2_/TRDRNA2_200233_c0_seq1.p1 gnl/TRDRNA2_/TRDRNA2_200233_c0~~gnl/TRDRNA2_/TRDRNA2_200233_c0_seq1.p1  ORF type:complete len:124 (+),score=24.80 gnl/TRDRNA2_/TRDRNA2_200233_c0_seq1:47-418(+)
MGGGGSHENLDSAQAELDSPSRAKSTRRACDSLVGSVGGGSECQVFSPARPSRRRREAKKESSKSGEDQAGLGDMVTKWSERSTELVNEVVRSVAPGGAANLYGKDDFDHDLSGRHPREKTLT